MKAVTEPKEGINEDTLILNSQSDIGKTIYANTERSCTSISKIEEGR